MEDYLLEVGGLIEYMDSIKLMMEEHQYILRMLEVVRKACYGVMKGDPVNYEDFDLMIDFIRSYADAHHHGKEEKLLFNEMVTHLGPLGNKLITHGMLVEHDSGRLFIQELKEALNRVQTGDDMSRLDVIANAISYTHLLQRHIGKEDAVVYTFAERQLSKDILEKVNRETVEFEEAATSKGTQKYYQDLVASLEAKYV
jgi:hemerythrin-like domain-containing protein